MLDTLRPTSAGLDGLPAWYLKVAAPLFCNQLAYLFNLSFATASVPQPHQWKEACITPVPKVSAPQLPADYRPISITPILTRIMERAVVPAFQKPPPGLEFSDQFAPTHCIYYCSHHQSPTNCYHSAPVQSFRCSHFARFFQGVRYCPPFQSAG